MNNDEWPTPPAPKRDYAAIFRWVLVATALIAPPIYLAKNPQDYTPLVQVLISIFLFLLAYWVGFTREVEKAAQRANDRWLPQAESVTFRLMTLRTNVCGFSRSTKSSCSNAACDLPELKKDEMRAVKIKMKADCEASSQRLDDIAHQLEDAIEDWRRFIIANCAGDECQRIWEALLRREERLERQLAECQESRSEQDAP
jgi:hypothetical protein